MYLLDTNVVSELRRARTGRAHRNVVAWANGVPAASLFLSVISILEIETGGAVGRTPRLSPRLHPGSASALSRIADALGTTIDTLMME